MALQGGARSPCRDGGIKVSPEVTQEMAGATPQPQEHGGRSIILRWLRRMSEITLSASRRSSIMLAFLPFVIAVVVYFGAFFIMDPSTTGDEPHYLIYTNSLVHDRDFDLRNNYEDGDVVGRFYASSEIDAHGRFRPDDGRWLPWHNIGLPILLSPVLYLHESVLAARVLFIVLSALLAHQIFRLLQDSNIAGPRLLWPVWAAVAFSLPLLTFSNQIYPEIPAALLLVFGARVTLAKGSSKRSLFVACLAAAALPWLHIRFLPFTAGLALGIAYRLLEGHTSWSGLKTSWPRLLLLSPIPVSGLLLAFTFNSWFGSPLPPSQADTWTWSSLYKSGLGILLSPSFGWLPFAPVHWLGIVGLVALARIYRPATALALLSVAAYLFIIGFPAERGGNFAARYLVSLTPFVGIPLLLVVKTSRAARVLFVGLLGLSLTIGVIAIGHYTDLYPRGPGTALPLARELQEAWPMFPTTRDPTGFRLLPENAPRLVGKLVVESGADKPATSRVAYASPASDPPGFLSYGPYKALRAGTYLARFNIAASGDQAADQIATLDIFAGQDRLLAKKELRLLDLPASGEYVTVEVPFETPDSSYPVEARVHYTGKGEVWLKSIEVVATDPNRGAEDFPSWPRSLLWVVGTAFVAFLVPWRGQSLRPRAWGSPPENREPPVVRSRRST